MPFVFLAQEAAHPTIWESFQGWMDERWGITGAGALMVLFWVLLVLMLVTERVSMLVVGRLTSRTDTKVDDVFVAGIPTIVRTVCVLLALQVAAEAFILERRQELATRAIKAIAVVTIGILATRLVLKMFDAWVEQKPAMRPMSAGVKLAIKVLVIPIILITLLQALNIEVTAFLTALGVGALAVGLALQDVLRNVFAGVQLVLDQPVRAGDYIQLSGGTKGTVIQLGLRSTRLRTPENNTVILPNATLANEIITNVDLLDRTYAHTIPVFVALGSDARRVQTILVEEAKAVAAKTPGFVPAEVGVIFQGFRDTGLEFRVTARLTQFGGQTEPLSELNHRLYERLRAERIEFPAPPRATALPPKS